MAKVIADKYYGLAAQNYDADRCHSLRWANEQLAVADWVFSGPVLDVPLGTARYGEIYRQKGLSVVGVDISPDMLAVARSKYPEIDARQGSIFDLPFPDESFGTVVCTRLLDWLPPAEMRNAVSVLRRLANIVVVTIRHGKPECRVNYTHSLASFYEAIDGLYIDARRTTEVTQDGIEEIFRLRLPTWDDALAQFHFHDALFCDPNDEIQRLADEWVGRYWPFSVAVNKDTTKVTATYWPWNKLWRITQSMAGLCDQYITDELPRIKGGPLTVLSVRGRQVLIDGRRRVNQNRADTGRSPVLLLTVA